MPADPSTHCHVCGLQWQVRGCEPGKCGEFALERQGSNDGVAWVDVDDESCFRYRYVRTVHARRDGRGRTQWTMDREPRAN